MRKILIIYDGSNVFAEHVVDITICHAFGYGYFISHFNRTGRSGNAHHNVYPIRQTVVVFQKRVWAFKRSRYAAVRIIERYVEKSRSRVRIFGTHTESRFIRSCGNYVNFAHGRKSKRTGVIVSYDMRRIIALVINFARKSNAAGLVQKPAVHILESVLALESGIYRGNIDLGHFEIVEINGVFASGGYIELNVRVCRRRFVSYNRRQFLPARCFARKSRAVAPEIGIVCRFCIDARR